VTDPLRIEFSESENSIRTNNLAGIEPVFVSHADYSGSGANKLASIDAEATGWAGKFLPTLNERE